MTTYSLIEHKSLGLGIILSHSSDFSTYRVSFEYKIGVKEIINDTRFVNIPNNPTLDRIISSRVFEGLFDSFTKYKAVGYEDKIKIEEHTNYLVSGEIKGTSIYKFRIEINRNKLSINCSCPVNGLCKHLYAVFSYLRSNKVKSSSNYVSKKSVISYKDEIANVLYHGRGFYDFAFNFNKSMRNKDMIKVFINDSLSFFASNQYKVKLVNYIWGPQCLFKDFTDQIDNYLENNPDFNKNLLVLYDNAKQYAKEKKEALDNGLKVDNEELYFIYLLANHRYEDIINYDEDSDYYYKTVLFYVTYINKAQEAIIHIRKALKKSYHSLYRVPMALKKDAIGKLLFATSINELGREELVYFDLKNMIKYLSCFDNASIMLPYLNERITKEKNIIDNDIEKEIVKLLCLNIDYEHITYERLEIIKLIARRFDDAEFIAWCCDNYHKSSRRNKKTWY